MSKVDRVMTQVDRITEYIDHMPVAAFIFRHKESDEVHYSSDIRSPHQHTTINNKSSYFRVKLKRIKFDLLTKPDLDQT